MATGALAHPDINAYLRRVKGNRWQARPYDEKERFNLGVFGSPEEARAAVREFWAGKRKELPRFVRFDGDFYWVWIFAANHWHRQGPFETQAEAIGVRDRSLQARFGDKWADHLVERHPYKKRYLVVRRRRLKSGQVVYRVEFEFASKFFRPRRSFPTPELAFAYAMPYVRRKVGLFAPLYVGRKVWALASGQLPARH